MMVAKEDEMFGPFRCLRQIGEGGMAWVWEAEDTRAEAERRRVALKRIVPSLAKDGSYVEMFLDEARIAQGLDHPNICQVIESGQVEKVPYLAMEFIEGMDLVELQRRVEEREERIPFVLCAHIATEVCKALAYAHSLCDEGGAPLHLIHRDISPQNIMITRQGRVKIVDFGIAKAANRTHQTMAGVLKGKLAYMSPEQVKGRALDRCTDIFSLGVVLWELTAGRRLFAASNDKDVAKKIVEQPYPSPAEERANFPALLEGIIGRALEKETARRYSCCNEMHSELESYLSQCLKGASAPASTSIPQLLQAFLDPFYPPFLPRCPNPKCRAGNYRRPFDESNVGNGFCLCGTPLYRPHPSLFLVKKIHDSPTGKRWLFRVWDAEAERTLVMKLIQPPEQEEESLSQQEVERQLQREVEWLQSQNQNLYVVNVFEQGCTPERDFFWYLMEDYGEERTLRDYIRQCKKQGLKGLPFRDKWLLRFFEQMEEALTPIHRQQGLHRDLKPENVILLGDLQNTPLSFQIRLIDFGIACKTDSTVTSAAGSLRYMAPEQKEDNQKLDPRTDVYALGLLLYELFTFDEKLRLPRVPSKEFDSGCIFDTIQRATQRDPAGRHGSVSELVSEIRSNLSGTQTIYTSPAEAETHLFSRDSSSSARSEQIPLAEAETHIFSKRSTSPGQAEEPPLAEAETHLLSRAPSSSARSEQESSFCLQEEKEEASTPCKSPPEEEASSLLQEVSLVEDNVPFPASKEGWSLHLAPLRRLLRLPYFSILTVLFLVTAATLYSYLSSLAQEVSPLPPKRSSKAGSEAAQEPFTSPGEGAKEEESQEPLPHDGGDASLPETNPVKPRTAPVKKRRRAPPPRDLYMRSQRDPLRGLPSFLPRAQDWLDEASFSKSLQTHLRKSIQSLISYRYLRIQHCFLKYSPRGHRSFGARRLLLYLRFKKNLRASSPAYNVRYVSVGGRHPRELKRCVSAQVKRGVLLSHFPGLERTKVVYDLSLYQIRRKLPGDWREKCEGWLQKLLEVSCKDQGCEQVCHAGAKISIVISMKGTDRASLVKGPEISDSSNSLTIWDTSQCFRCLRQKISRIPLAKKAWVRQEPVSANCSKKQW
jgi:serine/threonine protein kinase